MSLREWVFAQKGKILEEKSLGGRVFVSWENRREWEVWGSEKSLEHGLVRR